MNSNLIQAAQTVAEWDGVCVLGHCNSPSGCEGDGACRANLGAQAAQPLTEQQMHRLWRKLGEGEGIEEFASAVIAEFCRINNITLGGNTK